MKKEITAFLIKIDMQILKIKASFYSFRFEWRYRKYPKVRRFSGPVFYDALSNWYGMKLDEIFKKHGVDLDDLYHYIERFKK